MYIYWLCLLPFILWFLGIFFAADRLNSTKARVLFDLAAVLCFLLGVVLYWYRVFPSKPEFFVGAFAVPLIFLGSFELLRLIYEKVRHETPCINVRSGRWIGDRPVDGFFTQYPPGKVISWADVLFGISQMLIPMVITMTVFIITLVAGS